MKQIKNKTKQMLEIEIQHSLSIEDILHRMYVMQNLDMKLIAGTLCVSVKTISAWLEQCGLYSHRLEEYEYG